MTLEELKSKRSQFRRISEKHGVANLRVFGSVVRGEQNDQSDLDLLVKVAHRR